MFKMFYIVIVITVWTK